MPADPDLQMLQDLADSLWRVDEGDDLQPGRRAGQGRRSALMWPLLRSDPARLLPSVPLFFARFSTRRRQRVQANLDLSGSVYYRRQVIMSFEGNRFAKQRWLSGLLVALLLTNMLIQLRGADKKKQPFGIFEQTTDIGQVRPGSSSYDPVKKRYTITGGGADIWGDGDDFHFLWRKVSANGITLTCTLELPPESDDPYPKAGLMLRESLDRKAPFVAVLLHSNGTVALQFRRKTGGQTEQMISPTKGNHLILERKDRLLFMSVGTPEGNYVSDEYIVLDFPDSFYAGLAVCAHNRDRLLTAHFSDVTLDTE